MAGTAGVVTTAAGIRQRGILGLLLGGIGTGMVVLAITNQRVLQMIDRAPHLCNSITQLADAFFLGAECRAEYDAGFSFHTMSNDPAPAVITGRRQSMYRAFETVECMSTSAHRNFKRFIVLVTANFACAHFRPSFCL